MADYLGVKLATENNQRGYDLIDADGLRVSVKTITTSTGVSLKESTVDLVDRVVVVWLDTNEGEVGVHVAYDAGVRKIPRRLRRSLSRIVEARTRLYDLPEQAVIGA